MNWKLIILWKNFEVDLSRSFSPLAPGTHLDLTSPCKSLLTEYPTKCLFTVTNTPWHPTWTIIFSAETHLSSLCFFLGGRNWSTKAFITQHISTSSPQVLKEYSTLPWSFPPFSSHDNFLTSSYQFSRSFNKYSPLGAPASAPSLYWYPFANHSNFSIFYNTINCQI